MNHQKMRTMKKKKKKRFFLRKRVNQRERKKMEEEEVEAVDEEEEGLHPESYQRGGERLRMTMKMKELQESDEGSVSHKMIKMMMENRRSRRM